MLGPLSPNLYETRAAMMLVSPPVAECAARRSGAPARLACRFEAHVERRLGLLQVGVRVVAALEHREPAAGEQRLGLRGVHATRLAASAASRRSPAPFTAVVEVVIGLITVTETVLIATGRAAVWNLAVLSPGFDNPENEELRQRINRWIRTSGEFDAVADLDQALRDPAAPATLAPAYDSGDHIHLNDAGAQCGETSCAPYVSRSLSASTSICPSDTAGQAAGMGSQDVPVRSAVEDL